MRQPKALRTLFLTEMWERYGFYTMQAMLVLYMIKRFSFSDADSYAVLGQFTALVYLMPVIGGWVCDRFLGNRIAILLGGLCLSIGYALLALEYHTFFMGLSFIIVGSGLLKPNISSFLGQFYGVNDSRREAGFTLFYVGINTGVLMATLSVGYIREFAGWGACFGAACFALLIGVALFRKGFHDFEDQGLLPSGQVKTFWAFLQKKPVAILWFLGVLSIIYFSMTSVNFGSYGLYIFGLLFLLYVLQASLKLDAFSRKRMFGLLLLFAVSILFWGLYFQMFFAVNVFTERAVDRVILGHDVPPAVFIGLESLFVLILGPLMARLWQTSKIKLSIPLKFSVAVMLLAIGMQLLAWGISDVLLPAIWLVLFYFLITVGELLLSPIGLSMITEYAPKEHIGLMMGGWFLTLGFGGKLTGVLAMYASVPQGITDLHDLNLIYQHAFQQYAWLGFAFFIGSFLLAPWIKKWLSIPTSN